MTVHRPTTGKFDSLRDAVVYRATLDGTCITLGDVDEVGFHVSKLTDFYGYDYLVIEEPNGFVTVEKFDHIDIGPNGYYEPITVRWAELEERAASALYSGVMVCEDCYIAHHYGWCEHDGKWYAGESDAPADREPLANLRDFKLYDWTDSTYGFGIDEFSMASCEGCGSMLGGKRYRLMVEGVES